MADLSIEYAGIELKNPIVAVAGPLGRTYESLKRSIEAGCGAVTLKSANAKPPEENYQKPSSHVYPKPAHAFLKKYGMPKVMINWEGVPPEFTAEKQADMIERIKPIAQKHNCKIIANIHPDVMYLRDLDAYRKDIATIMAAKPDMLEICFCPYHLPPESTYTEKAAGEELVRFSETTWGVAIDEVDVPMIAKANYKTFGVAHDAINKRGIDLFHITEGPWFYGTVVDVDKMEPLVPGPGLITYGEHRRLLINNHVARTNGLGEYEVMSSSGVWTANDALERMMCGSKLVGMHTAIQYHGHKQFTKVIEGLSKYLDKTGRKMGDIVGAALPKILSNEAHDEFVHSCDLTNDQIRPEINFETCIQCATCASCIHGGIDIEEKSPVLNLDNCVRCGVCESRCPVSAIELVRD